MTFVCFGCFETPKLAPCFDIKAKQPNKGLVSESAETSFSSSFVSFDTKLVSEDTLVLGNGGWEELKPKGTTYWKELKVNLKMLFQEWPVTMVVVFLLDEITFGQCAPHRRVSGPIIFLLFIISTVLYPAHFRRNQKFSCGIRSIATGRILRSP